MLPRLFTIRCFVKERSRTGWNARHFLIVFLGSFFAVAKFRFQSMWLRQMIITIKYTNHSFKKLNKSTNVLMYVICLIQDTFIYCWENYAQVCFLRQRKIRKWYSKANFYGCKACFIQKVVSCGLVKFNRCSGVCQRSSWLENQLYHSFVGNILVQIEKDTFENQLLPILPILIS